MWGPAAVDHSDFTKIEDASQVSVDIKIVFQSVRHGFLIQAKVKLIENCQYSLHVAGL